MTKEPWWRCVCGEQNPPRMEYCSNARCRKPAPWKQRPEPKPAEPEKPRAPRPEWLVKLGVWLVVFTPIVTLGSLLLPPPWNGIIRLVFEFIRNIIQ